MEHDPLSNSTSTSKKRKNISFGFAKRNEKTEMGKYKKSLSIIPRLVSLALAGCGWMRGQSISIFELHHHVVIYRTFFCAKKDF